MDNMTMTHYMELLASNQPWNLILFMAIPVILAEFIAVTELYVLFTRNTSGGLKRWNRYASMFVGVYFLGIFLYLFTTAVVPLTTQGLWRGPFDVIAVGFYLLGVVPLVGMALIDSGLVLRGQEEQVKLKNHAVMVGIFLVVAHIAMIFGMLSPHLLMA